MENRFSNEYFEQMATTLTAHEARIDALMEVKKALREQFGCESEAYEAACDMYRKANDEFPYTFGQMTALRSWQEWAISDVEVEACESLFNKDVKGFVETLREAGIKRFWYARNSTAAVENFFDFITLGCSFDGVEERTKDNGRFSRTDKGIWFKL